MGRCPVLTKPPACSYSQSVCGRSSAPLREKQGPPCAAALFPLRPILEPLYYDSVLLLDCLLADFIDFLSMYQDFLYSPGYPKWKAVACALSADGPLCLLMASDWEKSVQSLTDVSHYTLSIFIDVVAKSGSENVPVRGAEAVLQAGI